MGIIHMEVESVAALANELARNAGSMEEYIQGLLEAAYALGGAWKGDETGIYIEELNSILQRLKTQAAELADLGRRVSNEKEQWVLAGENFGDDTSVSAASPGGTPGQQPASPLKGNQKVSIILPWNGNPMMVSVATANKIKQLQALGFPPAQIRDILLGDHAGVESKSNQANAAINRFGYGLGDGVARTSREFFTGVDSGGNVSPLAIVGSTLSSILPGGRWVVMGGSAAYRVHDLMEKDKRSFSDALAQGAFEAGIGLIPGKAGLFVQAATLTNSASETLGQTGSIKETLGVVGTGLAVLGIGLGTAKMVGGLSKLPGANRVVFGSGAAPEVGVHPGVGGPKTVMQEPPLPGATRSPVREGGMLPEEPLSPKAVTSGGAKSGVVTEGSTGNNSVGGRMGIPSNKGAPPAGSSGGSSGAEGNSGGSKEPPSGGSLPKGQTPPAAVGRFERTVDSNAKGMVGKVAKDAKSLKQAEVDGFMGDNSERVQAYHAAISDGLNKAVVKSVPRSVSSLGKGKTVVDVKVKEVHIADFGSTNKGRTSFGSDHDFSLAVVFEDKGLQAHAKKNFNNDLAAAHHDLSTKFLDTFQGRLDKNFQKQTGASLKDVDAKVYNGIRGGNTGQSDNYSPRYVKAGIAKNAKTTSIYLGEKGKPDTVMMGRSGRDFHRAEHKAVPATTALNEPRVNPREVKIKAQLNTQKKQVNYANGGSQLGLKDAAKTATRFETARQQLQAYSEHKTFKGVFSEAQKKWLETKMDPEMAKIADHVRNNPQTGPASLTPTQREQFINYVQDFFKNMQVPADE